jgi:hypothetical protein
MRSWCAVCSGKRAICPLPGRTRRRATPSSWP